MTRDTRAMEMLTLERMEGVLAKIKSRKAPGLDMVPSEVAPCVIRSDPSVFCEMVKDTLVRGEIPRIWKTARVVILPKHGKDPMSLEAYRPISILPALGKAWEYAIKEIIEEVIWKDP